jgi:hypothetical protein
VTDDPCELNRYRRIAQVTHQALTDYASMAPAGDLFKTFPDRCCGDAAELLARYLNEAAADHPRSATRLARWGTRGGPTYALTGRPS